MEGNRGVAPTQAANQGDDWQFVKGTGGEPDLWVNKKTKEVTYASHSTQGPGLPYTEFNRNVVSTTPGVPSMVQTWKVGPKGEQTLVGERAVLPQGKESLNPTTLAQIMDYRRKMGVQNVGEAGLRYPGGQYAYMLDQKLNRLNEATGMPRTDRPALNPLTSRSIIDLANRLESAGYIPREAFEMALERHPEVIASIQAGKLEEKDFNDQGWLPGTWTDKDAGGNYLPNFGGSYLVPQGFTVKQGQTDYSNLAGRVPVPFVTRIAAQPDLASVVAAGTQVRPEFAEFMAPGFSADGLNVGSYYYSGTPNNPTFSVVRMVNGQRALVPVTGIGQ
jgi:hypothetical protein